MRLKNVKYFLSKFICMANLSKLIKICQNLSKFICMATNVLVDYEHLSMYMYAQEQEGLIIKVS